MRLIFWRDYLSLVRLAESKRNNQTCLTLSATSSKEWPLFLRFGMKICLLFLSIMISGSSLLLADQQKENKVPLVEANTSPESKDDKPVSQFSYKYPTEVVIGDEPGFPLSSIFELEAKKRYKDLNDSLFFKTSFVRDVPAVREFHTDSRNPDRGELISIQTVDGIEIKCTFFDRGSDTLIVVGPGFTNEREIMTPFVKMFSNYNVVIFDFRGHGYEPSTWYNPMTWHSWSVTKNTFGMDSYLAKLGEVEERDVAAVVTEFKTRKTYKNVFGVSVCYGSFIFLKAQALYPGLFDRIVVDGTWNSVGDIVEKIRHDLKLLCKPQTGGWKEYWISRQPWFQSSLIWAARNIFALNMDHDVRLVDYLPLIEETPILFFYGKDDLLVYRDEFEELWNSLNSPYRATIVTSNPHVVNHYKQKEVYKAICESFFTTNSLDEFKSALLEPLVEILVNG